MQYITLDIFKDGTYKHKDWVCAVVCESKFSHLIKYIVEEESKDFINNQPERLNEKAQEIEMRKSEHDE